MREAAPATSRPEPAFGRRRPAPGPFRRVLRCAPGAGPEAGKYRYLLEVALAPGPHPRLMVIGKNPSTASASRSDPTLGKAEAWARRRGFGSLALVNLFALRSPYPRDLNAVPYGEAVGEENDAFIREAARRADRAVAAWGNPNGVDEGRYARRIAGAAALLKGRDVHVAGMTKKGHPRHGLGWNSRGEACPAPAELAALPIRAGAPPRRGRR
ncbi:MAG: DUF1643 domain-containing protein [Candidatus Tectomicrobia bacterium]|uniref:DUF1643 domain-containing protein n=1 Tax=Tectimicrobiota bacterium TaxID=2528274 RepID=A0A932ZS19_UNCTE|nr:DUF1643 domain-containing protein [Candidatus Tectomicrobia bacterium]MBI4251037.1 DUF1643 domain-containing protein [Candidatus Tectomicrobia bacterium]